MLLQLHTFIAHTRELVGWLAKDVVSSGPEVTWEAVIGHDEVTSPVLRSINNFLPGKAVTA